jgi:hypothetical protein
MFSVLNHRGSRGHRSRDLLRCLPRCVPFSFQMLRPFTIPVGRRGYAGYNYSSRCVSLFSLNTLIRHHSLVHSSCSALLRLAFWIAVARFSLLHRPSISFEVRRCRRSQQRLSWTGCGGHFGGPTLTRAGYSHHTFTSPVACRPETLNTDASGRLASYHQGDGPPRMSLAYKVEELLALRDSVSESAVSLDKFADEDVIKGQ